MPTILTPSLRRALSGIELVAFDFDGVFTDNRVLVGQDGGESVMCSRADGFGLQTLRRSGVRMIVLSTEVNPVVTKRCEKLGLPVVQGLQDKAAELHATIEMAGVAVEATAFVGNDINDIECLEMVGVAVCVSDAYPAAAAHADLVLGACGGHGAVREFCDLVVACKAEVEG